MTKISFIAVIAIAALLVPMSASGGSTSNLTLLYIQEDSFRNYDFDSQYVLSTNVDWPVTLVFWNNANINKVKNSLDSAGFQWGGDSENGRLNDGYGYVWDTDGGRKNVLCPFLSTDSHYRIYAPSYDYLYNVSWGFYVIGTTHRDHNECGPLDTWYGKSDEAENEVAFASAAVWGSGAVASDWAYFYNYEPYRAEGSHIWLNDGYATAVRVP